jgi:hypothetical protein
MARRTIPALSRHAISRGARTRRASIEDLWNRVGVEGENWFVIDEASRFAVLLYSSGKGEQGKKTAYRSEAS